MVKKQLIITSLGNALEWFDFGLFIFMAPLIGAKFFPQQTADAATLEAYIVFAIGFICRPLGGLLFGYFGDTKGRAITLRISVIMMTLSTLIGVIPSYATIGPLASILFIFFRVMQGISIGGEYSGVAIYLAESAPQGRRGLITSFAAIGSNFGFLLATLSYLVLHLVLSSAEISNWAWRIPFIIAGIPGSWIVYRRFKLPETKQYADLLTKNAIEAKPFLAALRYAPYQLLKIFGLTCMSSSFYYVFLGYMPTYLELYLNFPLKNALIIQSCLLFAMLFLIPLGGICGDYLSRKKMLLGTGIGMMLVVFPCFYILQTSLLWSTILVLSIMMILSSLEQGNGLAAAIENCPENVRYSVIAFSYNLGNALFGGTAPLAVTLLIDKAGLLAPSYYLMMMGAISLMVITTFLSDNKSLGPIERPNLESPLPQFSREG